MWCGQFGELDIKKLMQLSQNEELLSIAVVSITSILDDSSGDAPAGLPFNEAVGYAAKGEAARTRTWIKP